MQRRLRPKKFFSSSPEDLECRVRFSLIHAGELCTLNFLEHCMSGACGEMSLITNGGSGSSRISASIEIAPFVVDENN